MDSQTCLFGLICLFDGCEIHIQVHYFEWNYIYLRGSEKIRLMLVRKVGDPLA